MTHEILSVKLYELDKKLSQVHSRIQLSESASHGQIRAEIEALQRECKENELTLRNRLQFSKASAVTKLAGAYSEVEQLIQKAKAGWIHDFSAEEKILLAEYALDFAMQAANHALLLSMEALDAEMTQQENEEEERI